MAKWVLAAVVLGAAVGFVVRVAWGSTVGLAVGVVVAVLGLVVITLRPNQEDLEELEQQLGPDEMEGSRKDRRGG